MTQAISGFGQFGPRAAPATPPKDENSHFNPSQFKNTLDTAKFAVTAGKAIAGGASVAGAVGEGIGALSAGGGLGSLAALFI